MIRRFIVIFFLSALLPLSLSAQADRKDVRRGNREYRKGEYAKADVSYRKARLRDSLSLAANYNLASNTYRQEGYDEAGKMLDGIAQIAAGSQYEADYWYNKGNVALAQRNWQGAMDAYKKSLLLNPGDVDAKENYAYAKKMREDEQDQDQNGGGDGGGGGGDNDQNQDDQDQNQDEQQQDQDQNQDGQQPSQSEDRQDQQEQPGQISPQQAQQMLQAIQAKEQETQEKVDEKKAAVLQARQREKNW